MELATILGAPILDQCIRQTSELLGKWKAIDQTYKATTSSIPPCAANIIINGDPSIVKKLADRYPEIRNTMLAQNQPDLMSSSTPGTDPDSVKVRVVQDSEGTSGTVQTPPVVELPADVFSRPSHLRPALFPVVTPPRSSIRDLQAKASMARVLGSA
ncbi:hypothetical protein POM88_028441 [Heracleum sosnowskyi]|uniref:Uncharacterized protein n=1 Tax=Heracleum sosnowskyi TaxID=360622 RepID=A0AAD8HSU5_9APIA|nr:hypothetical protein POM88_028441 [Heracleum sosnowskyi]